MKFCSADTLTYITAVVLIIFLNGCNVEEREQDRSLITFGGSEENRTGNTRNEDNDPSKIYGSEIEHQLYENLFDDLAYYSKIICDGDFPLTRRHKSAAKMHKLFEENALIEDYINGRITKLSWNDFKISNLYRNEKCFFSNIQYDYELLNDVPVIIFTASKMIYRPDISDKIIILMKVTIKMNASEDPRINKIEIEDVEECL